MKTAKAGIYAGKVQDPRFRDQFTVYGERTRKVRLGFSELTFCCYNIVMTRTIPAVYENGVFRPTQPVGDLPEHASVRLTIETTAGATQSKRVLGLQRDKVIYVAPDFDAELGDDHRSSPL